MRVTNGDHPNHVIIGDADKEEAHNKSLAKVNYKLHGSDWDPFCTTFSLEQSPINLSLSEAVPSSKIKFELLYNYLLANATVSVDGEGSMIRINYPNELDNDIKVYNEQNEPQLYHLSHFSWKVPSEHTVDNRQLAAELQIFHVQYATNRQVAYSILFDKELALH